MTPPVVNKARLLLSVVLLIATVVCILPVRADDKLKPEDLVAKHLESMALRKQELASTARELKEVAR